MVLKNKLGITNQAGLKLKEELLSKKRAKQLIETGKLFEFEVGTFKGLAAIHQSLFQDIYDFAGKIRDVDLAKGDFTFALRMFLEQSLEYLDKLPQVNFDEIVDKYAEMNIAHPFREGNGRSMRLWLDNLLRAKLGRIVDWNNIDKNEYLNAMKRSPVSTGELKYLLQSNLMGDLSKESFFNGIDVSYYYEGYNTYKTEDLE